MARPVRARRRLLRRCGARSGLLLLGWLLPAVAASAQEKNACDPVAPAYYRAEEDCRGLALYSPDDPKRSGLQRLRYLPLDTSGEVSLTLGTELRWRHETYDPPRFGLEGGRNFNANEERFLVDADLRATWWRLFVQLDTAAEQGWPQPRPFDHSAPDVSQAFIEVAPPGGHVVLRLGRQELDLPGNRLVAVNDPAGIRRDFDGLNAFVLAGSTAFDLFAVQPVLNQPGAFDDTAQPGEHFVGLNAHHAWTAVQLPALDVFVFRRDRDASFVANAQGRDRRDTWGMRLSGQLAGFSYAGQLDVQRGSVGATPVRADGFTLQMSRTWSDLSGTPTWFLSAARASGDSHPNDGRLGSFDPLYPNLSYSTDAGYLFPSNIKDVSTSVALTPFARLQMQGGLYVAWRVSRADAVYQPPGFVLVASGAGSGGRIANLPFLSVDMHATRYLEFSLSAIRLVAGPVISSVNGRSANYLLTQSIFRF